MLEYALKQERAKFHKLKYGVELQQGDVRPPQEEPPAEPEPAERAQWKQGRQLIKQYLQVLNSFFIFTHICIFLTPDEVAR